MIGVGGAGAHRDRPPADGQLDIRMRDQIEVPRGMPGVAALGRHEDVAPAVVDRRGQLQQEDQRLGLHRHEGRQVG